MGIISGFRDIVEAFMLLLSYTGNVDATISVDGGARFEDAFAQEAERIFRVRDATGASSFVSNLTDGA